MSKNKKVVNNTLENIQQSAGQLGLVLMAAATVTGVMELPDRGGANSRVVLPGQPSFVQASDSEQEINPVRREKEETDSHYISYSETQRTPSRASKH